MNKKLVVRTVGGLLAVAVLFAAYQWLKEWTKDPDRGSMDTTDMIAAVEFVEGGSRLVVFDADGKKTEAPGYVEGRSDVDPVWRPDGQRVFFVSTRMGTSNNIFRWNIASNSVEHRLGGSRSASSPTFGPPDWPNLGDSGLVLVGGNVFDFNQRDQRTQQILPPLDFENTGEEAGSQLAALYERMGSSFKSAMWGKDRKVMYTVMNREDDEIFVVNYMEAIGDQPVGPVAIFAGQSIQFDVAPDGTAVVSIQGFEFPDASQIPENMMVNGRAVKPWRNGLFAIRIQDDGHIAPLIPLFADQPDLGVEPIELTPALRTEKGIPAAVIGTLVGTVGPGSVGESLKVKSGDVIVSVGGGKTDSFQNLFTAMRNVRLGIETSITFWSATDKAVKTVPYTFGAESSMALKDPAFSPDSKTVAVVVGYVLDKYTFEPRELVLVPIDGGLNAATRLLVGRIFEPNWHPSGKKLAYVQVGEGGDSQIFVIGADGSQPKNISGPGEFGSPKFSPYMKK